MIERFTPLQKKAIGEKLKQLRQIKDGTLSPEELAKMITQRRLEWLEANRHFLGSHLLLKDAYKFLIYYHMKVEDGILMRMNGDNVLRIECTNVCPYLEASKILGLDTRFVCKEIGEPSLRAFFQQINPRFHFSRDYNCIRPHSSYCLEFLEER